MLEKLEGIAKEVCKEKGFALYDVELKKTQKGRIYIVYITKIDGVSIDDCRLISKAIDSQLNTEEIEERFFLEVSSPGLERQLKTRKHFAGAINQEIKIKFRHNDKYKNIRAMLTEVQPEFIKIKDKKNDEYIIEYEDIKRAKTHFDFVKGEKK